MTAKSASNAKTGGRGKIQWWERYIALGEENNGWKYTLHWLAHQSCVLRKCMLSMKSGVKSKGMRIEDSSMRKLHCDKC